MGISWLQFFLILLAVLVILSGLVTVGLSLRPRPFRPHPAPTRLDERVPFVPDLPAPVRRHFSQTLGEDPPRMRSAVVWGRGKANLREVWTPLRFKAWYRPGESFYRRMEFTFFQRLVMRGIDRFLHGEGTFELGGRVERGPGVDLDEALALWAEAVWTPAVFVNDPRVRWEPVDEQSARLRVKVENTEITLLASFDPLTGYLTHFTSQRISPETGELEPWRFDLMLWKRVHGLEIPCEVALAWGETGSPWLYLTVDGVAYNVNVADQLG